MRGNTTRGILPEAHEFSRLHELSKARKLSRKSRISNLPKMHTLPRARKVSGVSAIRESVIGCMYSIYRMYVGIFPLGLVWSISKVRYVPKDIYIKVRLWVRGIRISRRDQGWVEAVVLEMMKYE